jgi:MMPL family
LGFVDPIVRAALYEDLAPGERQARHAAAAQALAQEGASPERLTAHLLLTAPTGDQGRVETLRGAPRAAAARLRRALAEGPGEQERAEILTELGRYEVAAMQFETAEEHPRACLASGARLATRADAASTLGRCAIVSGEAAGEALASLAQELATLDRERSLELGSELLMLATAVPQLRIGLAAFRTVVIPIQAAVMNALSIGAAYGVLTAIVQYGWLHSLFALDGSVPIVSYVPLFAALIMVFVFGSFVLNGDPTVKQFGIGLTVAVILDATIVRCLLVPALMVMMGNINWYSPAGSNGFFHTSASKARSSSRPATGAPPGWHESKNPAPDRPPPAGAKEKITCKSRSPAIAPLRRSWSFRVERRS